MVYKIAEVIFQCMLVNPDLFTPAESLDTCTDVLLCRGAFLRFVTQIRVLTVGNGGVALKRNRQQSEEELWGAE